MRDDPKKPEIPIVSSFDQAHEDACLAGQDWYIDPETGLLVFTRLKLLKNGDCCGSGCRHCPY